MLWRHFAHCEKIKAELQSSWGWRTCLYTKTHLAGDCVSPTPLFILMTPVPGYRALHNFMTCCVTWHDWKYFASCDSLQSFILGVCCTAMSAWGLLAVATRGATKTTPTRLKNFLAEHARLLKPRFCGYLDTRNPVTESFWQYSSDKQYIRNLSWLLSTQFEKTLRYSVGHV